MGIVIHIRRFRNRRERQAQPFQFRHQRGAVIAAQGGGEDRDRARTGVDLIHPLLQARIGQKLPEHYR